MLHFSLTYLTFMNRVVIEFYYHNMYKYIHMFKNLENIFVVFDHSFVTSSRRS